MQIKQSLIAWSILICTYRVLSLVDLAQYFHVATDLDIMSSAAETSTIYLWIRFLSMFSVVVLLHLSCLMYLHVLFRRRVVPLVMMLPEHYVVHEVCI
ncbi:hypothetical protein EDC04DRAFT_2630309 [Pisolithus marmoratus]|nr:hypothetical protein EDC04DRAFT_2630309 [Pisolithus marmoratus]